METMLKGPALTVTDTLVTGAPPRFVAIRVAWRLLPTATVPKFRVAGETESCPGVKALPVTKLVLLPPLLVKTTALLKLPALVGAKLTATVPVWAGAKLNGLPL